MPSPPLHTILAPYCDDIRVIAFDAEEDRRKFSKLGGLLVPAAVILVLSVLSCLLRFLLNVQAYAGSGKLLPLISRVSREELWRTGFILEAGLSLVGLAFLWSVLTAFFARRADTLRLVTAFFAVRLAGEICAKFLWAANMPNSPEITYASWSRIIWAVNWFLVFVPYFLLARRPRRTFVRIRQPRSEGGDWVDITRPAAASRGTVVAVSVVGVLAVVTVATVVVLDKMAVRYVAARMAELEVEEAILDSSSLPVTLVGPAQFGEPLLRAIEESRIWKIYTSVLGPEPRHTYRVGVVRPARWGPHMGKTKVGHGQTRCTLGLQSPPGLSGRLAATVAEVPLDRSTKPARLGSIPAHFIAFMKAEEQLLTAVTEADMDRVALDLMSCYARVGRRPDLAKALWELSGDSAAARSAFESSGDAAREAVFDMMRETPESLTADLVRIALARSKPPPPEKAAAFASLLKHEAPGVRSAFGEALLSSQMRSTLLPAMTPDMRALLPSFMLEQLRAHGMRPESVRHVIAASEILEDAGLLPIAKWCEELFTRALPDTLPEALAQDTLTPFMVALETLVKRSDCFAPAAAIAMCCPSIQQNGAGRILREYYLRDQAQRALPSTVPEALIKIMDTEPGKAAALAAGRFSLLGAAAESAVPLLEERLRRGEQSRLRHYTVALKAVVPDHPAILVPVVRGLRSGDEQAVRESFAYIADTRSGKPWPNDVQKAVMEAYRRSVGGPLRYAAAEAALSLGEGAEPVVADIVAAIAAGKLQARSLYRGLERAAAIFPEALPAFARAVYDTERVDFEGLMGRAMSEQLARPTPEQIPRLMVLLNQAPDGPRRGFVAAVLAQANSPVPGLAELLVSQLLAATDNTERLGIAHALRKVPLSKEQIGDLGEFLKRFRPFPRGPWGTEFLLALCNARWDAPDLIAAITARLPGALANWDECEAEELAMAMADTGQNGELAVLNLLKSRSPAVRQLAARVVEERSARGGLGLMDLYRQDPKANGPAVCQALSRREQIDPSFRPILVETLSSASIEDAKAALQSLRKLPVPSAEEQLELFRQWAQHERESVVFYGLTYLSGLRPTSLALAEAALSSLPAAGDGIRRLRHNPIRVRGEKFEMHFRARALMTILAHCESPAEQMVEALDRRARDRDAGLAAHAVALLCEALPEHEVSKRLFEEIRATKGTRVLPGAAIPYARLKTALRNQPDLLERVEDTIGPAAAR